jgi:hypothetical protein
MRARSLAMLAAGPLLVGAADPPLHLHLIGLVDAAPDRTAVAVDLTTVTGAGTDRPRATFYFIHEDLRSNALYVRYGLELQCGARTRRILAHHAYDRSLREFAWPLNGSPAVDVSRAPNFALAHDFACGRVARTSLRDLRGLTARQVALRLFPARSTAFIPTPFTPPRAAAPAAVPPPPTVARAQPFDLDSGIRCTGLFMTLGKWSSDPPEAQQAAMATAENLISRLTPLLERSGMTPNMLGGRLAKEGAGRIDAFYRDPSPEAKARVRAAWRVEQQACRARAFVPIP